MEKSRQAEGMSLNYKINGRMCSFKSVDELLNCLKNKAKILDEPLTVEPIGEEGRDYDHMQEILELTYQAIPCIKGLQAMAGYIQEHGNFIEYDTSDIVQLGLKCRELLDELMDIAEASEKVYESDWEASRVKAELRRHEATA
jgi:hypothetical protein